MAENELQEQWRYFATGYRGFVHLPPGSRGFTLRS
ncbi:conserved hypothetical protein, partial [delta proteobacterium NaphS2]